MHRNKHTIGLVAAGVAVSLTLAGAAAAALVGHRSAHTTRVSVTESEYKIAIAPAKVQAGSATFVIRNHGKLAHALDISGPGLKTVKVPTGAAATGGAGVRWDDHPRDHDRLG
jgi:antitoxin (DNA-binding transcriptional repressor) of toxin-antitoxin stability system